jgi:hypothetical protein
MQDDCSTLLLEIAGKKKNLVIFAGAGIPSATGIPTWPDLLEELEKEVGKKCHEKSIKDCKASEYPKFAQNIYETFIKNENGDKAKGENKYHEAIRRLIETKDWDYGPSQLCIVHVCKNIVTTNFDVTFEDAYEDYCRFAGKRKSDQNIKTLTDVNYNNFRSKAVNLVYLHGKTARKIIFKEEDYERYYSSENPTLKDFYEALFRNHTMLFLGFSFDDKYILGQLKEVYEKVKYKDEENKRFDAESDLELDSIRHYAFIKDIRFECKQRRKLLGEKYHKSREDYKDEEKHIEQDEEDFESLCEELKSMNIIPLRYDYHKKYRRWLNKISDYKRTTVFDVAEPSSDTVILE